MEAAALFTIGRWLGVAVACALVVSDAPAGGGGKRLDDDGLEAAAKALGTAAAAAFAI